MYVGSCSICDHVVCSAFEAFLYYSGVYLFHVCFESHVPVVMSECIDLCVVCSEAGGKVFCHST